MERDAFFARVDSEMRNEDRALSFERPPIDFEALGLKVAQCHANADFWISEMPEWKRVRGWLKFPYATHHELVAHSLVEGPHGERWDVTPYDDPRSAALATLFVKHPGTDEEFDEAVEQHKWIRCLIAQGLTEAEVAAAAALIPPAVPLDID